MKTTIIILTLLILVILSGTISVDERQKVVVTNIFNNNTLYTLDTGVHLIIPGIEQPHYIFMNPRYLTVTRNMNFGTPNITQVTVRATWHIVDAKRYFTVHNLTQNNVIQTITAEINNLLTLRAQSTNLGTFNQLSDLLDQPIILKNAGVVVTHVILVVIQPMQSSININTSSNPPPTINNLQIESAYYQAHMIKMQADITASEQLQKLALVNHKFYNYFRLLMLYKNAATLKQELPPLDLLYKTTNN